MTCRSFGKSRSIKIEIDKPVFRDNGENNRKCKCFLIKTANSQITISRTFYSFEEAVVAYKLSYRLFVQIFSYDLKLHHENVSCVLISIKDLNYELQCQ
jgi:hypothetical protein